MCKTLAAAAKAPSGTRPAKAKKQEERWRDDGEVTETGSKVGRKDRRS